MKQLQNIREWVTRNPLIQRAQRRSHEETQRFEVILTAQRMSREGLSPGRSGNVSVRLDDGFLITPTGLAYDSLDGDDIVKLDFHGTPVASHRLPSSEWRFHLDIYRQRPDIAAIVHCHSRAATVLACAHREIPAFHYMVAAGGGTTIRCAPYALFGTQALSDHAVAALHDRTCCLLANHGQIATGQNLSGAYDLALEVEELSAQYLELLKLDQVHLLSDQQMAEVLLKFKSYGQQHEAQGSLLSGVA